jgi:hypothetical protein
MREREREKIEIEEFLIYRQSKVKEEKKKERKKLGQQWHKGYPGLDITLSFTLDITLTLSGLLEIKSE